MAAERSKIDRMVIQVGADEGGGGLPDKRTGRCGKEGGRSDGSKDYQQSDEPAGSPELAWEIALSG